MSVTAPSGNKSDRSDAYVLADCLRTDGHRWRSASSPTRPATVTLRTHVRARKDLVETRVAVANQLRAHLRIVFPGAVGLFRDIDSPISLRFLERFPSATRAAWLSEKRLGAWLRANGYCGRKTPAELHAPPRSPHPPGSPATKATPAAPITLAYVTVLKTLRAQIDELDTRLDELLDAHPDAHIFRSLPRCATVRAATLLAEIGDCRARFPDPESLCLPRRRRPLHPSQRPPPRRHLPLAAATRSSATPSATSPATAGAATPGPTTATANSAPTARPTPTPNASSPAAGPTSSGAAGKTTPPYDPARHGAHQRLTNAGGLT